MLTLLRNVVSGLGSQNFLGSPWIGFWLDALPPSARRAMALRLLALSPHYFYRTPQNRALSRRDFLESEYGRNLASRRLIVEQLVRPFLKSSWTVLDYGCGPGFLARAAAPFVARVVACDISAGVLACARVLNGGPNIDYRQVSAQGRLPLEGETADLIYSFAVVQHVTDSSWQAILAEWFRVSKAGAVVVCHVVIDAPGWQTESQWRADRTLRGRLKWRLGLHCFSRSRDRFTRDLLAAGFAEPVFTDIRDLSDALDDDIRQQQLCIFRKPEAP